MIIYLGPYSARHPVRSGQGQISDHHSYPPTSLYTADSLKYNMQQNILFKKKKKDYNANFSVITFRFFNFFFVYCHTPCEYY